MASFMDRLKTSINILSGRTTLEMWDPNDQSNRTTSFMPASGSHRYMSDTTKAVLAPMIARIAIDAANLPMRHVIVDEFRQFKELKQSELNDRLSIRANLDQSGTAFLQDAFMTMLYTGACVLVPVEISSDPTNGGFDILSMRVGSVLQWYTKTVDVYIYNELTGDYITKNLPKEFVAIAYNPMYAVMNEQNSTLSRLINRLNLLDSADGRLFSPQLDLILQLPYALKSSRSQAEAERRLDALYTQLEDRKYGIAYIDASEKVTQLNRPVTNELFKTVQQLTESLHSQLGLTPEIFAGNASQEEVIQYNNRTILPLVSALADAMVGSFFTRTAIRQGHYVMAFPNLFKMAPLSQIAESADLLTRNEIITSNEVRAAIGLKPSKDPEADELRNKNLNKPVEQESAKPPVETPSDDSEAETNEKE